MASTEDIEAKLAAYVDGDLDAASRLEIEKHLASNPQHRQLIAELMEQRTLLRALPREAAPQDLADALSGQLERAVLLGDVDAGVSYSRMRINRWSQIRAVAAVVLLAGGLFAAVYWLLPSSGLPQPELASIHSLPATRPGEAVPVIETTGLGLADSIRRDDGVVVDRLGKGGTPRAPTEQERRAKEALVEGPIIASPRDIASNAAAPGQRMFQELVTEQMGRGVVGNDKSVVLVINTDNPDETNRRVASYLAQSRLSWEAQTQPMPGPLNLGQQQVVVASRHRDERVQLKVAATVPSGAVDEQVQRSESDGVAQAPVQQPIDSPVQFVQPQAPAAHQALAFDSQMNGQIYVARGVPRQQVGEIRRELDSLNKRLPETPSQSAAVAVEQVTTAEPGAVATTQPALAGVQAEDAFQRRGIEVAQRDRSALDRNHVIKPGDVVVVDTPELVGPGAEPRTEQRVGPDGTITLHMLEPFSCAGMTGDELARVISEKYRQINISAGAKVTVSLPAPTTQFLGAANDFGMVPATQPSAELVDVVILVQPLSGATPPNVSAEATPPTTEPTTAPAP